MRNWYFVILFIFLHSAVAAGGPVVPGKIEFADMRLDLHPHVQREIQEEVDALHRSQKYFNIMLERVNLYFPIIERIFKEENVPDDFKYLVIQESALISDAVSTSNAVGFWQFKIPSAQEVGLRVDRSVDERLNISAATRGAAKYLKRNNFYFNNWVYALLSYNMGVGGANSLVNKKYFGAKQMDLNRKTHWYLIKFLAHKIAFEEFLDERNAKRLYEYTDGGGMTLSQIAGTLGVDYEELKNYNKWLRRGKVPEDKLYAVIVPGLATAPVQTTLRVTPKTKSRDLSFVSPNSALYPKIKVFSDDSRIVKINGIPGIVANDGDDLRQLAALGGLELSRFLRLNEIDISHQVRGGNVYYFKKKKNKASEHYHTVLPNEDLWIISQKYGVKKQKLLIKNRLGGSNEIKPGMVLWLRYIRSADQPIEYIALPEIVEEESKAAMADQTDQIQDAEVKDPERRDTAGSDDYDQIIENIEEHPVVITESESNESDGSESLDNEPDSEREEMEYRRNPLFHIVERGETLFAISRKYQVPINEIYRINNLGVNDPISIGQKIYLQDPFSDSNTPSSENSNFSSESYINYTVKKGDTMYSISRKFNVSVEELLEWNGKTNYNLVEGEILKIRR